MHPYQNEYVAQCGYPAAGRRCLIDTSIIEQKMPELSGRALEEIRMIGYSVINTDLTSLARSFLDNQPLYRRGAWTHEAPQTIDCSLFIKYLFSQIGLCLERTSNRQMAHPITQEINVEDRQANDLIFWSGKYPYDNNVGHVSMVTADLTIIHATDWSNKAHPVKETSVDHFAKNRTLVGARRILHSSHLVTVEAPSQWPDSPTNSLAVQDDLFRAITGYPELQQNVPTRTIRAA